MTFWKFSFTSLWFLLTVILVVNVSRMSFHLSQATWALIAQSLNHKSITPLNSRYTDTHMYTFCSCLPMPALLCWHFKGSPNRLQPDRVVGITPHGLCVAHCPVPSGQPPSQAGPSSLSWPQSCRTDTLAVPHPRPHLARRMTAHIRGI